MRFLAALMITMMATPALGAGSTAVATRVVPKELVLISSLDLAEQLLEVDAETEGGSGGSRTSHDPPKMMLLSLAVPGAGQIVQGEKRGYIYLLLEAAMWGGFYYLDKQGLEERDDYEDFVIENWNLAAYQDFFEENCLDNPQDYANGCRPLAPEGSQEFYEDVGKYDVYWPWWSGDGSPNDITAEDMAVRNEYWGMRKDSNSHLREARYFIMAALLNHVVSALDSFFIARPPVGAEPPADLGLEFGVPDESVGLTCELVARY